MSMETITVRREFSDTDLAERGKRLAQLEAEITRLEDDLQLARQDFKRLLDKIIADRKRLALEIRMGGEDVEVEVAAVLNQPELGQKTYFDAAGRTVKVVEMTDRDRQGELFSQG